MKRKRPRLIVDPEWIESNKDDLIELMIDEGERNPVEYFPECYDERLKESNLQWIMITRVPWTEIVVPFGSIWLGELVDSSASNFLGVPWKLFEIQTPLGSLRIRMDECSIIDIKKHIQFIGNKNENGEDELSMKFLNENNINNKVFEQIFYLRTRGISKETAYSLVLNEMTDPNFCYLVWNKNYQRIFCRDERVILDDVKAHEEIMSRGSDE